jgi:hypothetical protein
MNKTNAQEGREEIEWERGEEEEREYYYDWEFERRRKYFEVKLSELRENEGERREGKIRKIEEREGERERRVVKLIKLSFRIKTSFVQFFQGSRRN